MTNTMRIDEVSGARPKTSEDMAVVAKQNHNYDDGYFIRN